MRIVKTLGFMLGGSLLTLLVLAMIGNSPISAQQSMEHRPVAAPETTAVPQVSREQFTAAVFDKTQDEVIQAVGRPDSTSNTSSGTMFWYYGKRTYDPISGTVDFTAQVVFDNGYSVTGVNYH